MDKLDIICGKGKHRTWNAAFAEMVLLNIYGQMPDYFWRLDQFKNKYLSLIKLIAMLGKKFSQNEIGYFIYKENTAIFEKDIGLITWKLKNHNYDSKFTIEQLVSHFKNKFRPINNTNITNVEIKPVIKTNEQDIIGDL